MAATAASIKVVKTFTYRGAPRSWSNRYHFTNDAPTDASHWTTLSDNIVAAEKAIFQITTGFTITQTLGYAAGSEIPVFSKTYATAMTGSFSGTYAQAGDCAAMVRYATATRTSKNHPLFLYNWYHGVYGTSAADPDTLLAAQRTAMGTYASSWITGFSDGTTTHRRCGPKGDLATGSLVSTLVRHRDFPRG